MEANYNLDAIKAGHENKDASVRPIVLILVGLAVSVFIVGLLVYGIFSYLADHPLNTARPNPLAESVQQVPSVPQLDTHPGAELKQVHSYEDSILSTYGWTDKQKGIVRIPIDQAMQLELQRGYPTRPAAATTNSGVARK